MLYNPFRKAFLLNRILILTTLFLSIPNPIFGEGRELNFNESQIYWELAYEVGLYYGFKPVNDAFERPKGQGIKRMPWQPIDDSFRHIFHPSEYGTDPLDKEEPYNHGSDLANRAMAYYTLGAVPLYIESGKRLGAVFTTLHMIETTFYLNTLLRTIFSRFRPRSVYRNDTDYDKAPRNSFPSGHASQAFAWATSAILITDLGPLGSAAFYSIATVASLLRLSGGQHFFSDLVAGAIVGTAVPWGVYHSLHKKEASSFSLDVLPNELQITYRF